MSSETTVGKPTDDPLQFRASDRVLLQYTEMLQSSSLSKIETLGNSFVSGPSSHREGFVIVITSDDPLVWIDIQLYERAAVLNGELAYYADSIFNNYPPDHLTSAFAKARPSVHGFIKLEACTQIYFAKQPVHYDTDIGHTFLFEAIQRALAHCRKLVDQSSSPAEDPEVLEMWEEDHRTIQCAVTWHANIVTEWNTLAVAEVEAIRVRREAQRR